jgi:hypothetical protein
MLGGGQDAAEKFDGLCECEKFMVSMMTVKHAKRKVNALLFKLQFISCLQSIAEGENRLSVREVKQPSFNHFSHRCCTFLSRCSTNWRRL